MSYIDNPIGDELIMNIDEDEKHSIICALCYGLIRGGYLVCNGCQFLGCS